MKITNYVDRRRRRLVSTWKGVFGYGDMSRHFERRAAEATFEYDQLLDATEARFAVQSDELKSLAGYTELLAGKAKPGRTALVASEEMEIALVELFAAHAAHVYTLKVFDDRAAALEWLGWDPAPPKK